jgi:hypothetical protein
MTNHHWTNNAELVEKYVLNQLEPSYRQELEQHLMACEHCQNAVREEKELAADVRRLARDEFKAKLRSRLQSEPASMVPWVRLAAAAAVIIILVGVGVYNDWFGWYGAKLVTEEFSEEKPIPQEVMEEPREDGNKPARRATQDERVSPGDIKPDEDRRTEGSSLEYKKSAPQAEKQSPSPKTALRGERDREQPVPMESAAGEGLEIESRPNGIQKDDTALKEAKKQKPATSQLKQRQFWVEGNVLSSARERTAIQHESPESSLMTRKQFSKDEAVAQSKKITVQRGMHSQTFTLSQRATLEPKTENARKPKTIPTLVEQTDQGLQLTLYLDQPVRDEELKRATIEPVREDSIILYLGNLQIGYRLPGTWFDKPPAK